MMENHFIESEETTFSALSILAHFIELAENYFSWKNCLAELLLDIQQRMRFGSFANAP